jgi:hypothetical protein
MKIKRDERCMICLDTASEGPKTRTYCAACGKPTCVSCQNEYIRIPENVGMGCVGCRSTLDVLYIIFDDEKFRQVVLRLNGNHMLIDISNRALRLARKNVAKIHNKILDEISPLARIGDRDYESFLDQMNIGCELSVKHAVIFFLAHEITRNPRAKAMVNDRFTKPYDEGGYSRVLYASVHN